MKNLCKKAEMGIGTLIIFIAMILVAAIAAGVLLQTASSLQNKALLTGEKSKAQVSTNVMSILLYAEDGSTNNNLEYFYLKAKLAPGSDPIKLDELLIEFDLINGSADLSYKSGNCVDDSANGFNTNPSTGEGNYTVKYLIKGDSYTSGYLNRGDVVEFCFESPRSVGEDEDIKVHIVPKVGVPSVIEAATPDVITDKKITIYP